MKTTHKKGHAEGRAEGLAEGRAEGERNMSIAIARNLKQMGIALEDIAAATGLSDDDIKAI